MDHGAIDWRDVLDSTHWLVNSSDIALEGEPPRLAWAAAMLRVDGGPLWDVVLRRVEEVRATIPLSSTGLASGTEGTVVSLTGQSAIS